jgi:predicted DNA repair protein MutK
LIGHPEATLVIPNDGRDLAKLVEEVSPDRTLPVVLEIAIAPKRR